MENICTFRIFPPETCKMLYFCHLSCIQAVDTKVSLQNEIIWIGLTLLHSDFFYSQRFTISKFQQDIKIKKSMYDLSPFIFILTDLCIFSYFIFILTYIYIYIYIYYIYTYIYIYEIYIYIYIYVFQINYCCKRLRYSIPLLS